MADYAIHDTTLIGTSNIIRKKEGSSALIDPADYPKRINLMGMLEEKTVSGSIAHITDGADEVPIKSWEVEIAPTLTGKSAIECTQTGKNLLPDKTYQRNANTLRIGTDTLDGTLNIKAGTYTLSVKTVKSGSFFYTINGTTTGITTSGDGDYRKGSFTLSADSELFFHIYNSSGITSADVSELQLEAGSSRTTYEPYTAPTVTTVSLGRTIYGGTADVVNGQGESSYKIVTVGNSGWNYYASGGYIYKNFDDKVTPAIGDTDHILVTDNPDMPYGGVNYASQFQDLHVYQAQNKAIYIKDTSCTSVNDFYAKYSDMQIGYELATPENFTFTPIAPTPETALGTNNFWADEGDSEVTYRSSGTVTPVVPTLISKTITANGIYFASDDGVDGYDTVAVNVPSVEPTVTPLNSPNAFLTLSSVTGTDVTRTVRTETAPSDGKYVFASDSTCRTNTGGGDGFIEIQKNGVSVVKQYMSANTTTDITIPNIEVEAGDEVTFVVGFDNNHSSCNFQLYTGIAFVSEVSAPSLLSMSPSEEVNENTEEVEENEQNDIER